MLEKQVVVMKASLMAEEAPKQIWWLMDLIFLEICQAILLAVEVEEITMMVTFSVKIIRLHQ